jgi:hypothetical protein
MTKNVFETSLRARQIRQPFKPFEIELESGSAMTIRHPEAIVTFGGAAVFIDTDLTITMFDADGVAKLSDPPSRRTSAS